MLIVSVVLVVRVRVSSSPPVFDDDDATFDRRPLLNLINEFHRRQTTTGDLLPARPVSPFRPVIIQKRSEVCSL